MKALLKALYYIGKGFWGVGEAILYTTIVKLRSML